LPHITLGWDLTSLPSLFQAGSHSFGDCRKASLNLASEHLADAGQLLSEPTHQAAHVALFPIRPLRQLEKAPYARERRSLFVMEAGIEASVDLRNVCVDNLQREIFLVFEVMIKGTLGSPRGREQGLNAQMIVAVCSSSMRRPASIRRCLVECIIAALWASCRRFRNFHRLGARKDCRHPKLLRRSEPRRSLQRLASARGYPCTGSAVRTACLRVAP
jgi:hypothetical protein